MSEAVQTILGFLIGHLIGKYLFGSFKLTLIKTDILRICVGAGAFMIAQLLDFTNLKIVKENLIGYSEFIFISSTLIIEYGLLCYFFKNKVN